MPDKDDNKPKTIIRKDSVNPTKKNRIHENASQESLHELIIRNRMDPPPPPKKR
jgi:hypothetical protein